MANNDLKMTLDDAVSEVMASLLGIDYSYDPAQDRYHVIARCLNSALRAVAREHEWSYFADTAHVGETYAGQTDVELNSNLRTRIVNDDAVRLQSADGHTRVWAYFLPRDALHKYRYRDGLWVTSTRSTLAFSRPISAMEADLNILVPVMREPRMFQLSQPGTEIPPQVRRQLLDFDNPDLVLARASYLYAQTDPVLQPRVQTLEAQYKDIMYALVERDERHTDSTYINEFTVPIKNGIHGPFGRSLGHGHPHSDERRL